MSDTILAADFTVYYEAENSQQRIGWTGSATGTRTVNQLYSALQDLFDESAQMDDKVPMSAQTPTDYTMVNGWFIDDTTVEHLTGGTIQTSGWASDVIIQRPYTTAASGESAFVSGDIGLTIIGDTSGHTGTILDYNSSRGIVWIRLSNVANTFNDSEGFTLQSGGTGVGRFSGARSSGEAIWANPNTIGSISNNTDIYLIQNGSKVAATKGADAWWATGHIDILLKVQEAGTLIDDGEVIVLARQYTQSYSHSVTDLSAGARTPVALSTGDDINNDTGNRELDFDGGSSGSFVVGEVITDDGEPDKKAIITAVTDGGATGTIAYYLIGTPLNDFANNDKFQGGTSTKLADVNGAPKNEGPSELGVLSGVPAAPTVTHAATDQDLNNGAGSRPYSITIDVNANPIQDFYEWTKHVLRRGSTFSIDGQDGEQYIGSDLQIEYDNNSGANFTEGQIVTGGTSAAFGTIVANHDDGATGDLILRNTRGTFSALETITDPVTGDANIVSTRGITTPPAASLGTFAGGVFFGAPGVWLLDLFAGDEQSFQLTDDNGQQQLPPNTVSITLTNLVAGDSIGVFRTLTAGGDIDKDEYAMTSQAQDLSTITVSGAISQEAPPAGKVRVVDVSTDTEQRYRYASFSGSVFTLTSSTGNPTSTGGAGATTLVDTGADFVTDGVEVGDIVRNATDGGQGIVTAVTDLNTLQHTALTGGSNNDWELADTYFVNATDRAYTTSDNVYVPFIDRIANTTPENNTIIHTTDIEARFVVRNAGTILPFSQDATIESTGRSIAAIRTPDTIFTP
jgi:hypothetical protein